MIVLFVQGCCRYLVCFHLISKIVFFSLLWRMSIVLLKLTFTPGLQCSSKANNYPMSNTVNNIPFLRFFTTLLEEKLKEPYCKYLATKYLHHVFNILLYFITSLQLSSHHFPSLSFAVFFFQYIVYPLSWLFLHHCYKCSRWLCLRSSFIFLSSPCIWDSVP